MAKKAKGKATPESELIVDLKRLVGNLAEARDVCREVLLEDNDTGGYIGAAVEAGTLQKVINIVIAIINKHEGKK